MLPNNEDPDSFARQHTADEFKTYIEAHATDFIRFKTALLLDNENDPLKRSEAINSIVMSISMVQNPILRDTYLHDCAQRIGMNEMTLINQMNALIRERKASGSMRVATKNSNKLLSSLRHNLLQIVFRRFPKWRNSSCN